MQTGNLEYTVNEEKRKGTVTYPDLWCFAFNPNYIEISLEDTTENGELTLKISSNDESYEIYVNLYRGTAKAYISKILQLFMQDVEHYRTANVQVAIKYGDQYMQSQTISFIVVWGGLQIGEQFGKYGNFVYNGKSLDHVRNVVWFKNFPFYVSLFRTDTTELMSGSCDGGLLSTEIRFFRCHITSVVDGDLPSNLYSTGNLREPRIILNKTHGIIYASGDDDICYKSWTTNDNPYGSSSDYMNADETIRTDTEFEYEGEIVRWNDTAKQLEASSYGNADTSGIFEVNPTITFPNAKNKVCYNICIVKATSAIFNMNFNFPFPDASKIANEKVNLFINNKRSGLYLRWIDRYGLIQFYLFVEGKSTIKAKASSDSVHVERQYNGLYIGNLERDMEVSNIETIKCCAVNLSKDILKYVKTIINAQVVDLYYGKSKDGTELWVPVKVSDGNYTTDPKTLLSDYEITIQLPEKPTQTL